MVANGRYVQGDMYIAILLVHPSPSIPTIGQPSSSPPFARPCFLRSSMVQPSRVGSMGLDVGLGPEVVSL